MSFTGYHSTAEAEDDNVDWRVVEVEQRVLENARVLWQRCVDQTRKDANDRANQLKNLAKLSAIIAGFSMSSFLEFNFDASTVSTGVLILYGSTTAAVAAINMCCMATCNLILGTVMQTSSSYITEEEESHFLLHCREFAIRFQRGDRPPHPPRSFRRLWDARCAPAWRATLLLFAAGIPLFLVNLAASAWVKFALYQPAAVLMTAIVGLGLAYLAIANLRWFSHLVQSTKTGLQVNSIAIEAQGLPWDWHMEPRGAPKSLVYSASIEPHDQMRHGTHIRMEGELAQWRDEDMKQQHLDNALALWTRFEKGLRTEMNENAERLRSVSFLAAIMLSFSTAALYQLTFSVTAFPGVLDILYALTIALAVAFNVCAMAVCSFLNMAIVRAGATLTSQEERAHFLTRCHRFIQGFVRGRRPPHPLRTFERYWEAKCERDWRLAFGAFSAGAVVFQLCLVCSAWLKFAPREDLEATPPNVNHRQAAYAMTAILGTGIAYFLLVSWRWARGGKQSEEDRVKWGSQPSAVGLPFDWHLPAMRRDSQGPLKATPMHPLAHFQPSMESPYAVLGAPSLQRTSVYSITDDCWEDGTLWGPYAVDQKHLANALALWKRFTDANSHDLEERSEQLKAVTDLAAVIAGFEMIAFLQFQFDSLAINKGLQFAYVATSGLTVALMAAAMTLCGIMLGSILESSSEFVSPAQEAEFIARCRDFCHSYRPGDRPPAPRRNFKQHWDSRCKSEWRRAFFMFYLGVPMFLANAAVTTWIKFEENQPPAIVVTATQGLGILYLAIVHARWVKHLVHGPQQPSFKEGRGGESPAGLPFDWHLPPEKLRTPYLATEFKGATQ